MSISAKTNPDLPQVDQEHFQTPTVTDFAKNLSPHPPKILLLYGSLRRRSFSRLLVEESARLLTAMGAETRIFNPEGLPLPDSCEADHPKVAELRQAVTWCEGMVWCSPERHGAITGIMKSQIDWIPLTMGAVRPTQGKTLAVMQVNGGSQSFNTVNQLRILGRWMRMLTIPNQSSVPKAFLEFDDNDRMKRSGFYYRVVDVLEELIKFTLLTRDNAEYLVDRYSERVETAETLLARVNQRAQDELIDTSAKQPKVEEKADDSSVDKIIIKNNLKRQRFEALIDNQIAYAKYEIENNIIAYTQVVVPEALSGQGIGSTIVRYILQYADNNGLVVRPVCPFVQSYIDKHPEYQSLVVDD